MRREDDEIQSFVRRLRPSVRYFFRAAYAITGDRQMAEYVLNDALVRAYLQDAPGGALGFRDSVLSVIREGALARLEAETPEGEWDGLVPDEEKDDPLALLLARESADVQRMAVLRYGCAMTMREIAGVMNLPQELVQSELSGCRARVERALAAQKRPVRPFERLAMRAVRQSMNRERDDQIDVGFILHAFETDLAGLHRPRRVVMRLVKGAALLAAGLACAALIWLLAVLIEM